jgi:FK506-binding protein 2
MKVIRLHRPMLSFWSLWVMTSSKLLLVRALIVFRSSSSFPPSTTTATSIRRSHDVSTNTNSCLFNQNNEDDGDYDTSLFPRSSMNRRKVFTMLTGYTSALIVTAANTNPAKAIVTDETDNFADNYWDSSSSSSSSKSNKDSPISLPSPSDEVVVTVKSKDLQTKGGIGLELGEIEFRTNRRVFVKSVNAGSVADQLGIQKDWVIVSINGETAERTNVEGVATMIYRASHPASSSSAESDDVIVLRFRNPVIFRDQLRDLSSSSPDSVVTTQVAPAGDTTQRQLNGSVKPGRSVTEQDDQRISVSQLILPKMCKRGTTLDDLMEISYIGRVVETGNIFDGSAIMVDGEGIPGRGNDISISFVLGKQPFGQFPPGWDVGLTGMCVGERRRILVPPVLAYGEKGLPRRGIPSQATLQYDVTLVSLNGLAMPR